MPFFFLHSAIEDYTVLDLGVFNVSRFSLGGHDCLSFEYSPQVTFFLYHYGAFRKCSRTIFVSSYLSKISCRSKSMAWDLHTATLLCKAIRCLLDMNKICCLLILFSFSPDRKKTKQKGNHTKFNLSMIFRIALWT